MCTTVYNNVKMERKHVSISFYLTREAIAAGSISPHWLKGSSNLSDIMTKAIASPLFLHHVYTLFWSPSY